MDPHQRYNLASILNAMNIEDDIIRESFITIREHQMEMVNVIHGVSYINDSRSTNVRCLWNALEQMYNGRTVLLMGGVDRGQNDYTSMDLPALMKEKVKCIISICDNPKPIIKAYKGIVPQFLIAHDMDEAVGAAYRVATKGDTVLMSPACASFDWFENFMERGKAFKKAVKKI